MISGIRPANTDVENGKVLKVRFRGANNGDSLLSVHVLLAPGGMWTAAVTADAGGIAQLTASDRNCTRPQLARNERQPAKQVLITAVIRNLPCALLHKIDI